MEFGAVFEELFQVRWSDLDANGHLHNTVFSEFATHTRFRLLETHGFDQARFEALRIGPVMFREEIRYRREVRFGEVVFVDVRFAGLSEDGSNWKVVQQVARPDRRQAAVVTVEGAWLDLDRRKLVAPPPELVGALHAVAQTPDFAVLRSVARH